MKKRKVKKMSYKNINNNTNERDRSYDRESSMEEALETYVSSSSKELIRLKKKKTLNIFSQGEIHPLLITTSRMPGLLGGKVLLEDVLGGRTFAEVGRLSGREGGVLTGSNRLALGYRHLSIKKFVHFKK